MRITQEEGTRQDAQRLPTAIAVRITHKRRKHPAVAINLSGRGLCLRTDVALEVDDKVTVALPLAAGPAVTVKGQVRWVFDAAPMQMPNYRVAAGVHFDDPDDDYLALVSSRHDVFVESRAEDRIPHAIRVDMKPADGSAWHTEYAMNLGRNGLFVRFDRPAVPGDVLDVRVFLPALATPIDARCEVVHVLDEARARDVGAPPGIGLHIVEMSADHGDAYRTYVDFLEDRLRL